MSTLISIFGPTSSGKSALALDLARRLPGSVVVNADSRQVYARLRLGVGKEPGTWTTHPRFGEIYDVQGVPHTLIDYVDPATTLTLVDYVRDFATFCQECSPEYVILVGGTGLYIDTLTLKKHVEHTKLPYQKGFAIHKQHLQALPRASLQRLADRERLPLNNSDYHNPRRLVSRLLEIHARAQGWLETLLLPEFDTVVRTALIPEWTTLRDRITARLQTRFGSGLIEETLALQDLGTSRLLSLGLEYRLTQLYLLGHLSERDYQAALLRENLRYARRQLTWHDPSNTRVVASAAEILEILSPSA